MNATTALTGSGGTGICSTITGQRVFYAGGGSGGGDNRAPIAVGLVTAGGGIGGIAVAGTNGTANTGGGGGGGGYDSGNKDGGAGGSGIVIIRYPATQSAPTATTGNPQINYADGYQIYTWTSNGTVTF
jgi:hypothetical protein